MHSYQNSDFPLDNQQIFNKLTVLRKHSLAEISHFTVAAIMEIPLKSGGFTYVSGVNVENLQHHRLTLHAEQNALITACTLLGKEAKFSKLWIMGALSHILSNQADEQATQATLPCGHCRQLLTSFADKNANIYSISINSKVSGPWMIEELLPARFSEQDLALSKNTNNANNVQLTLPSKTIERSPSSILNCLQTIASNARILHPDFITSPFTACLLETANSAQFIPGTIVQDIAFLSSDAIFTAIGQAVTEYGNQLEITAAYLYGQSIRIDSLSGSELQTLRQFIKQDIPIEIYTNNGLQKCFQFSEGIKAFQAKLSSELEP